MAPKKVVAAAAAPPMGGIGMNLNSDFNMEMAKALDRVRAHPCFAGMVDKMPRGIDASMGTKSGHQDLRLPSISCQPSHSVHQTVTCSCVQSL